MTQRANYTCTALAGTNKAGILKPNADGYYEVVLGALDVYNSAGAFYPYQAAKELFEESGAFQRRVANGALRGEYGHPKFNPGMSKRDFIARVMTIYEENVSHHIRRVWLDDSRVKDKSGRAVIAIMGEVKPMGPRGNDLKASLENNHENVCFSIRSLTDDFMDNRTGQIVKNLREIVTWDYVNEPGIQVANKYSFPALEGFEDVSFTVSNLQEIKRLGHQMGFGMESNGGLSVDHVMKRFGWDEPAKPSSKVPPSAKW